MKNFKLLSVLLLAMLLLGKGSSYAQRSEVGVSIVLSGHLFVGPYYRYWINDHHQVETCLMAAYENSLVFPGAWSAGYHYYFLDKHWRPSVGAQYLLLISPRVQETDYKYKTFSIFLVDPGVQFRWNDNKLAVEEKFWIAYMKINRKSKVTPLGLDTRFGVAF